MTRKMSHVLALTSMLLSLAQPSFGAPVELLVNGSFKDGLKGWVVEGVALLDVEGVRILREGSLSQIVQRPDLSFHLEFSYLVRTELPSKVYFARSVVTFYVVDREKRNDNFTIVGEAHRETGSSDWREVRLDLLRLFRRDVGDPENFQVTALKVAVELGFTAAVPAPAVACFRNIGLRRVNPARILVNEDGRREFPDRTELIVSVVNVGDMDAFNMVVTLIPTPEIVVISERTSFERPALEGRESWRLSWMLAARSSGVHRVVVRVRSDQAGAELSISVPVAGIPQITTTSMSTMTVERTSETIIVVFTQIAFLVMLALLIVVVVIPIIQSRKRIERVYRLRLLRVFLWR